ncbi:hypothetical protein ACFOQM_15615 [Paenibacillus sp. GCM10012307]|uniref:Uncharacterized protein n=1 Tax=Paenibacillus roseus TaxID=2798579 RepID=A0A934J6T3_9BACL|nr:hypothetical protein [Paenibacillus roseus]MBJ6362673.1 hypothetical protein [Paenibacillus roseus]
MNSIVFNKEEGGYYPLIRQCEGGELTIPFPVEAAFLLGEALCFRYQSVKEIQVGNWLALCEFRQAGYRFTIEDNWTADTSSRVHRTVRAERESDEPCSGRTEGVQFRLRFVQSVQEETPFRFHAPSIWYGTIDQHRENVTRMYMDDRMTYPLILGYDSSTGTTVSLSRIHLPSFVLPPIRPERESRYTQRTDIGSLGYSRHGDTVMYQACLPYYEGDRSVALSADQRPVSAFYPLDEQVIELKTAYELRISNQWGFDEAVFDEFKHKAGLNKPEPFELPFSLEDSMEYRSVSLRNSYRELRSGAAGFFFHFDPRKGYRSAPSGFGASFVNIPHESYQTVLEYGFTGRQIHAAHEMARRNGGEWWDKGKKVIDFFVDRCTTPSGWMYTLFEVEEDRPFHSFGDPTAPKLHYVSHGDVRGNYLRLMVEPAFDLLTAYQRYREEGRIETKWYDAVKRFGNFLVNVQNGDGSWYRAFQPDGTPLKNEPGFGDDEFSSKSGTAIPIMFLVALWREEPGEGMKYLRAAINASEYVLSNFVQRNHYQGGTLDNPNIIDKEAVQYTMAALYTLYNHTCEERYLKGAVRAARLFVTWNYIWTAPTMPGTSLHNQRFNTVGCGGINSIWGGGVVDIYSLFFIRELHGIGKAAGEPFFCQMAAWIANGCQQMLSYPGDQMGFADIGMQPEGFGICSQGLDEGMIAKGDIWGTLGWIYSAGLLGLGRYIESFR